MPILSLGGIGVISVLSNVKPAFTHDLVHNFFEGNFEKAKDMQLDSLNLINSLFLEVNPIPVKACLNEIGFDFGLPRLPLTPLSNNILDNLKNLL
ncbi:MAG: dihydrodipicolinate synthase family protein [Clostridia bacterium]